MRGHWTTGVVTEITKKLFQIQIQTILEIESQMTLDVV